MSATYSCPICHGQSQLFDAGSTTPEQFFAANNAYAIAAGHKQRLPIYTCTTCGHGFTSLDIHPDVITNWYKTQPEDTTFLADEPARRLTAQKILERLTKYFPNKGKLLDIGCGPGIFLSEAIKHSWAGEGIEPASWAAQHGQEKYHLTIHQQDISQLKNLPPESFNVITLFDVIEHVTNPAELIKSAAKLLKPQGILVITTPKFDSPLAKIMGKKWYCIFPAHIHYFTQKSLTKTLKEVGLKIIEQKSHTRYLSARYFWQRVKGFITGRQGTAKPQTNQPSLPINFGDEFEVYAQKG